MASVELIARRGRKGSPPINRFQCTDQVLDRKPHRPDEGSHRAFDCPKMAQATPTSPGGAE